MNHFILQKVAKQHPYPVNLQQNHLNLTIMKQKLFLTLLIAVLSAFCISSCSSEEMIETSIDEEVIASAVPRMIDSSDELSNDEFYSDVDSCGYVTRIATEMDSASFYKAYGKYISPVKRVIAEAVPNAPVSKSGERKPFEVTNRYNGSWYEVTIRYENLTVKYNTYYLYEFPQRSNDINKEYKVYYEPRPNEYCNASHVYRPDIYRLNAVQDLTVGTGEHDYEYTSVGIIVRIEGNVFRLIDHWEP